MLKIFLGALLSILLSFTSFFSFAEEEPNENVKDYSYFLLEPDIITNYVSAGKRIGFLRVTVELLVSDKDKFALVELHEPLIRDKLIQILGEQGEEKVKSITQRDAIRLLCLREINAIVKAQTGENIVEDLIFTQFLYQ
jgi:flagellar FliL protein